MANIPIRDMAQSGTPSASSQIVFDDGAMKRGTVASMADAVRPVASQSEAEAGADNTKVMSALRVKQSIASEVGVSIASKAQGDLANGALQVSGGTMLGNLILNANPSAALGAATKQYVDGAYTAGTGLQLSAGQFSINSTVATLTGTQTLTGKTISGANNSLTVRLPNDVTGLLQAANHPALTGDVTNTAGSLATTIANSAVTNAKMANMADGTIKSNISGGSAAPSDNTITSVLDKLLGTTRGSLMYRGAAAWAALSPGTASNVLTSNGAGADPSWQAGGGGGAAITVSYNNATSGLTATNVQAAIDELKTLLGTAMGFNDSVVDAGNAFWGIVICGVNASTFSNAGIYNPPSSGKIFRVDKMRGAIDGPGAATFGADVRVVPFPLDTNAGQINITNKKAGGRKSVAVQVTQNSAPPGYPYQEMWLGRKDEDHTQVYDPTVVLLPGYCIYFGTADQNVAAISSWEFREDTYTDLYVAKNAGTIVSTNLTNPSNAFDGNQTTYADNGSSTASADIGKNWGPGVTKKISRFSIVSPNARSFSGANPANTLTWFLEGSSNGSSWTQIDTGTYTEQGTGNLKGGIDFVTANTATAYQYHRARLVFSGSVGMRIAEVDFWELP